MDKNSRAYREEDHGSSYIMALPFTRFSHYAILSKKKKKKNKDNIKSLKEQKKRLEGRSLMT